ncbi:MAG: hypothetical protein ACRYHQ_10150 [Janthinobacterium lividum]
MNSRPLLAYYIARRNAAEMDRRGVPPNLLIRVVVGIATLASAVMMLTIGIFVLAFVGYLLGII